MISRREFTLGAVALAFAGLNGSMLGKAVAAPPGNSITGYGGLLPDPNKLLDLPQGFSYKIISHFGERMTDGFAVPDKADGMGCLPLDNNRVALIRNHELQPKDLAKQSALQQQHKTAQAYDQFNNGVALPGGTTTLIYNLSTGKKEQEFISLTGTIRNCAGGITPWGSWLTCEESVERAGGELSKDHGYIFEVPAKATGLIKAEPLVQMGRFNHEAAAVDPKTGIVYLTEDRGDGLFYRFVPNEYGKLAKGGKLQALVVKGKPQFDSRNWVNGAMPVSAWLETEWVDLENPQSPDDDLRQQGAKKGAAVFARGEGVHWGTGELYFCCTNGGKAKLGQIMRYQPSAAEGTSAEVANPGRLQLFFESQHESMYNFGDNLTVTPFGHLLVCEDQYTAVVDNHLRGVTPQGEVYNFARLHQQTELAGACFSPDGSTLFVNVYSPAKTLAIKGPWSRLT